MTLHRRGHDGDWRGDNHSILKPYAVDGWAIVEKLCEKPHMYNGLVMGHKRQSLYQWLYLLPNHRKYRSLFCVSASESMHLRTPIIIIVGLWLNQRVERIHDLTITYNHHANRADAGALVVGCLEINSCKVSHSYWSYSGPA